MKMKVVVVVCVSVLIGATEAGLPALSKFRTEIESKYCNGTYTCILHMYVLAHLSRRLIC